MIRRRFFVALAGLIAAPKTVMEILPKRKSGLLDRTVRIVGYDGTTRRATVAWGPYNIYQAGTNRQIGTVDYDENWNPMIRWKLDA